MMRLPTVTLAAVSLGYGRGGAAPRRATAMTPTSDIKWLYLDVNSYFASVEQQMDPALRGRPVAVVPVMTDSTCAIAASYEAKAFGVKTGMPIWEVKKLCPDIRLVAARHDLYVRFHHRIVEEIEKHVPITKVYSIDEVACALIGSERIRDNALSLGRKIKRGLIEKAGTCLRCSVGLAPTRLLAKVACNFQKPDGLTAIELHDLPDKLLVLDLRDLSGIGANMERRLRRAGIDSIAALWVIAPKHARKIWGSVTGERFWYDLHGVDLPERDTVRRSIGHARVLAPDYRYPNQARLVARRLTMKAAESAAPTRISGGRSRLTGQAGKQLSVGWRIAPLPVPGYIYAAPRDRTALAASRRAAWGGAHQNSVGLATPFDADIGRRR